MKTLKELEDELCKALFSPMALTHERHAVQDALRAAEQRGIERAAEWLLRDTQTDNRKEAAEAIRALAQGGK